MAEEEGGRWDVGVKGNAVYLERRSEENERLFADQIAPEEARELAELLTKYAEKADSADEDESDDDEDESNDDEDDSDDDSDDDDDSSDKADSKSED
jgi:hypothetical protein